MSSLKRLVGQTAIYGVSTILGRLLNYLLVPLYTYIFAPEAYGIVTELYAYAGFLFVIFTYGMETAFFRFHEKQQLQPQVFSTAASSLVITSLLFATILIILSEPIAAALKYPQHAEYISWFALIVALDAITAIPFALLRAANRAKKFAIVKLSNIFINIGLNLFFLLLAPWVLENDTLSFLHPFFDLIYDPAFGIGYIFISNLVASAFTVLLLFPQLKLIRYGWQKSLWLQMMKYSLPLVLVGLAGIINETLDRILLKFLLPYSAEQNQAMIGIYGACYKLSILLTLFVQAFRYAAEPFFFAEAATANAKDKYAMTLKYFSIVGTIIFLGVLLFLDIFKYFIGPEYHSGLVVVPILLIANLFLGIYYTQSVWYKITDRTDIGAYISIGGAIITIALNITLIPVLGYVGSAWATFVCYFSMAVASYILGQQYYRVPYPVKRILSYIAFALALYFVSDIFIRHQPNLLKYIVNSILLLLFIFIAWRVERPEKELN